MEISRPFFLNQLIARKHNGLVKIVTGPRGCGKTHLLFSSFRQHLLQTGVRPDHIHEITLGAPEHAALRDPKVLFPRLEAALQSDGMHYVLFDDIDELDKFPAVLNSLLRRPAADVYVTGRHARGLSHDVVTEFRGRGDEIRLQPLAFAECLAVHPNDRSSVWRDYLRFGGLPPVVLLADDAAKEELLQRFVHNVCLADLVGRHRLRRPNELEALLGLLAARTGALTNPARLAAAFGPKSPSQTTLRTYLDDLEDAFLITTARRFDIRGKRTPLSPAKRYFADSGLRCALLHFDAIDEAAAVENVVFNELLRRGFETATGFVTRHSVNAHGNGTRRPLAVDFVCNRGDERCYLQVAAADEAVTHQKAQTLLCIPDAFLKVLLTPNAPTHRNDDGVLILNLFDFLLDPDSLRL